MGFCPQCRSPEPLEEVAGGPSRAASGPLPPVAPIGSAVDDAGDRIPIGMPEVDRVLGGGLVAGSVLLLGGEPGVGKSTLVLQAAAALASAGRTALIATAEESAQQVGLRARRLQATHDRVLLVADDDVDRILAVADRERPDLLVVDSVQTVAVAEIESAAGGVAQVRESAARIIRHAKRGGPATILVGHVTKDGALAGPKLLEHVVDVVLSLDGDPDRGFRVLRGLKNRFGPTHVAGIFDMRGSGLVEVPDPSEAFLAAWEHDVAGTVAFPAVDGRRSILVEIQALVSPSPLAQPRRSVRGLDPARVHQVLAVLQRHAGLSLADREVFVNVVGGWRVDEPAADLAVALAVASSAVDRPLGSTAAWGEVGLAGEVRAVPHDARRREEAERVGLTRTAAPEPGSRLRLHEVLSRWGL
jgi:DNA repair protein RadA/Sms